MLARTILLSSLPIPFLAGAYWHYKVFTLYKQLGPRVRSVGYYWFSTQVQTPSLATQLFGTVDFSSYLSTDDLAHIALVRRYVRIVHVVVALWMIVAVALFCFAALGANPT